MQCVYTKCSQHNSYEKPILARNHEWIEEESQYLTLCECKPDGKLESFGFTFRGNETSRYGGINQAGLAISSASASFVDPGVGIIINLATRWILDNCKTVEEAVNFLEKIPKVWGETYIIIDRNDVIAKVESHSKKTMTSRHDNEFAFNTLAFDSEEMQEYNQRADDWVNSVLPPRKKFINDWYSSNKGNIDIDKIKNMLKNHDNRVCDHSTDGKLNYGICWSWVLTIGNNQALISEGSPCKNEFKQIVYFNH